MFAKCTAPYQIAYNANQIKTFNVTIKEKLQLFEEAINYIFTYKSSNYDLLNEIIGYQNTKCSAFEKLAKHRYYLEPSSTRSINYLICLLYINTFNSKIIKTLTNLDFYKIRKWLYDLLNSNNNFKSEKHKILNKKYTDELFINNGNISFSGDYYKNYPDINIVKLQNKYNNLQDIPYYTNKQRKLKLDDIYTNHNGQCQGMVRYWLMQKAKAFLTTKPERITITNNLIKSLEIKNKQLIDNFVHLQIKTYQQNNTWHFSPLIYIQDILGSNEDILAILIKIIDLIKLNNLNNLFAEIKTIKHEMGISFIVKGNYLKLTFYDPNDKNLYWHQYIKNETTFNDTLINCISNMNYFKNNKYKPLQIVISCYFLDKLPNNLQFIDNNPYIALLKDENIRQQLLLLAVKNNNYQLIVNLLNSWSNYNYLYDSFPLLYSAVFNSNSKIVKLLTQNNIKLNNESNKNTLITIASSKSNLELVEYLTTLVIN